MLRREFLSTALVPVIGSSTHLTKKEPVDTNLDLFTDILVKQVQLHISRDNLSSKQFNLVIRQYERPNFRKLKKNEFEIQYHEVSLFFLDCCMPVDLLSNIRQNADFIRGHTINTDKITFSPEQLKNALIAKLSNYFSSLGITMNSIYFDFIPCKAINGKMESDYWIKY